MVTSNKKSDSELKSIVIWCLSEDSLRRSSIRSLHSRQDFWEHHCRGDQRSRNLGKLSWGLFAIRPQQSLWGELQEGMTLQSYLVLGGDTQVFKPSHQPVTRYRLLLEGKYPWLRRHSSADTVLEEGLVVEWHQLIIFLEAGRIHSAILKGKLGSPALYSPLTSILIFSHLTRRLDINGCCGLGSTIRWCQDFCVSAFLGCSLWLQGGNSNSRPRDKNRKKAKILVIMVLLIGKVKVLPRLTF